MKNLFLLNLDIDEQLVLHLAPADEEAVA